MIINVLEKTINNKVHITRNQMRFLLLLSDNELHPVDEILDYMHWFDKLYLYSLIRNVKKIRYVNIVNIRGAGYRIDESILITKERTKKYSHNKEYQKEYQRVYRIKNKDKIKAYKKLWYLNKIGQIHTIDYNKEK